MDESLLSKNLKGSFADASSARGKSVSINESKITNKGNNSFTGRSILKKEAIKKVQQETYIYSELAHKMKIKIIKKARPSSSILKIYEDYRKNLSLASNDKLKSLKIIRMPDLEYIQRYNDSLPLLRIRKAIWRLLKYFTLLYIVYN